MANELPGYPLNGYWVKISVGHETATDKEWQILLSQDMEYGTMVGMQKALSDALVQLGVDGAHAMGQVVPGVDALPTPAKK